MHLETRLANKIMNRCLESFEEEINLTALAGSAGKPRSSIHHKISGNREWDAESWLAVLWSLGLCTYENGEIRIKALLLPHEVRRLDSTKSQAEAAASCQSSS